MFIKRRERIKRRLEGITVVQIYIWDVSTSSPVILDYFENHVYVLSDLGFKYFTELGL